MDALFARDNFFVVTLLVFVSVLLMLEAGYLWWRGKHGQRARHLQKRLESLRAERDAVQKQVLRQKLISESPTLERRLQRLPQVRGLARFVQQSGAGFTVARLLGFCALAGLAGWMLGSGGLHQPEWVALALAAVFALLPLGWLARRRAKRLDKLERQLPDALDLMSRALRAGHAFSAALKMAGEELSDPMASELRTVHEEINFGVTMGEALEHLGERIPLTDVRYFIVAVVIQRESGGNLTEVLGKLAMLVRERLKLMARIRVLSSEGRMSAWILGLMPFALGGAMYLVNPAFMTPLWTDPIGISIMKYTLGLMALGAVIMRKIIRIRI